MFTTPARRPTSRKQEQLIRHVGAQRARGVEGSGVEGRGGRRRSRSWTGPGSPRLSASSPSAGATTQQGSAAGGGLAGKRKRSLSGGGPPASAGDVDAVGKAEGGRKGEEDVEMEQEDEEEASEAAASMARPALVYCRILDALQHALKSERAGDDAVAGSESRSARQGILDIFSSGGDDLLQAASRAAFAAYEKATGPVGGGGGVDGNLMEMSLRTTFASARITKEGQMSEVGEKKLAAACRERVMNLLSEGELLVLSSSRSS